jgi:hypothetical protein
MKTKKKPEKKTFDRTPEENKEILADRRIHCISKIVGQYFFPKRKTALEMQLTAVQTLDQINALSTFQEQKKE